MVIILYYIGTRDIWFLQSKSKVNLMSFPKLKIAISGSGGVGKSAVTVN